MNRPIVILLFVLALAGVVLAQSEFELGGDDQWVQTAAPAKGSDEAVMAQARLLLAQDHPKEARKLLKKWIKEHDRTDNPYLPTAFLLRGDATAAAGDEYKALYDYEQHVIIQYPASEEFVTACERELDIAIRYVHGMKRKLWGVRLYGASDVGEELLVRVQERLPGSRLAERAGIELADFYYRTGDMTQASEAYAVFLANFPNSRYAREALLHRVYANIARFKGPRYDASGLIDAKYLIQQFAEQYPADAERAGMTDALLARIDESAGVQMLDSAKWYLKQGDAVSARFTLRRLLRDHPRTIAASRAVQIMTRHGWIDEAKSNTSATASEPSATESPSTAQPPGSGDTRPTDDKVEEHTP